MDYSDTTVVIPIKDEPAVGKVARDVSDALPGCRIIVIYKGGPAPRLESVRNAAVVRQRGNGKGNACLQAAKLIGTDIMCFIDGDATYEAKDLRKVVAMVRDGADLALGNRLDGLDRRAMPAFIEFGNRVISGVANLLYFMRVEDTQTGLRALRKGVFDALGLGEQYFGIESEMTIKARKRGLKIAETPIKYYSRVGSSKQMKLIDGVRLLLLDFKFIFN